MANTEGGFQMEIRGNNAIICPAICFEGREGADRRGEPFSAGEAAFGAFHRETQMS